MLPWLVEADSENFDTEVTASVPVLVDFWAQWCGPCKWLEPALQQLAQERAGRLKVVRVDIDAAPDPASRFAVQSIPTLVLLQNGKEVDRVMGAVPKPQLGQWLDRHTDAAARASS